jgi:nucleoside-diphosphate-sugar epimerase
VLVTGGAGFVGSHVAERLLAHGVEVVVLDALLESAHAGPPEGLDPRVELVRVTSATRKPFGVRSRESMQCPTRRRWSGSASTSAT